MRPHSRWAGHVSYNWSNGGIERVCVRESVREREECVRARHVRHKGAMGIDQNRSTQKRQPSVSGRLRLERPGAWVQSTRGRRGGQEFDWVQVTWGAFDGGAEVHSTGGCIRLGVHLLERRPVDWGQSMHEGGSRGRHQGGRERRASERPWNASERPRINFSGSCRLTTVKVSAVEGSCSLTTLDTSGRP